MKKHIFTMTTILSLLLIPQALFAGGEEAAPAEPAPVMPAILKFSSNDLTVKFSLKYNYLEFFGNKQSGESAEDVDQLVSNAPLGIGLGLKFKFLSGSFSFAAPLMPGVAGEDTPSVTFDTALTFYLLDNLYFDASLRYYQGFHEGNIFWFDQEKSTPLQVLIAGISGEYVLNEEHSLSSVYNLDKVQTKTNSSPIAGAEFYYHTLLSKNGDQKRYAERQHFIHLGPNGGYSHTSVFGGGGFFNAMAIAGVNWDYDPAAGQSYLGWQIQPKFSAGRHFDTWSFNAVIAGNMLGTFRNYQLDDTIVSANLSFNISKRFDMTGTRLARLFTLKGKKN